jgi:LytS/YehU family sensor histidine kinase
MLLKLSDLLSYMLYECDQPLVLLEKEIEMMKDYIALEKIRLNDSVEMELSITGDMTGKMIAPFLLLPFIENSFKQSSKLAEQAWMNRDISMEGETFCMKLANGMLPETNSVHTFSENGLVNVERYTRT